MSGLGAFAIGAAPIFGGLLLGSQAGKSTTKVDLRGIIKEEWICWSGHRKTR